MLVKFYFLPNFLLTFYYVSTNFLPNSLLLSAIYDQSVVLVPTILQLHTDKLSFTYLQTPLYIPTNSTFLVSKTLNSLENFKFRLRLTTIHL